MPELPEVETVRRSLLPLVGRHAVGGKVYETRLRKPVPRDLPEQLAGDVWTDLQRRGKYLLVRLRSGRTLLVHLGMTGQFYVRTGGSERLAHDHIVLQLDDGQDLVFHDPRRFGVVRLGMEEEFREVAGIKPDPLDPEMTTAAFQDMLRGRKKPIKNLLMDQGVLSGVGNIYANEALFLAGIRPGRQAGRLSRLEAARLFDTVREVLIAAIALGGSSISDYRDGRGQPGYFQLQLKVYDRAGEPCPKCSEPVKRVVHSGRSTFYCRTCQR